MRKISTLLFGLLFVLTSTCIAADKPMPPAADRAMLSAYLSTISLSIENFELSYELAYRTGNYQETLDDVAKIKKDEAELYAVKLPSAQRLDLVTQLKRVRAAELAVLDGGAPTTTEPKYAWKARLSALKAAYASAAGALKVELETAQ